MAFKHSIIYYQSGCILWLRLIQDHDRHSLQLTSCWALPSEFAVLFDWNLSFFLKVVNLDLLICTEFDLEHVVLFQCTIFPQRPINDGKIEWSNDAALVGNKFPPVPSKISFHMKIQSVIIAPNVHTVKRCKAVQATQFVHGGGKHPWDPANYLNFLQALKTL